MRQEMSKFSGTGHHVLLGRRKMTKSEWETCGDPLPMLELLGSSASARKLRLFAVACVRRYDVKFKPGRAPDWPTANLAHRYADGQATDDKLRQAWAEKEREMLEGGEGWWDWPEMAVLNPDAFSAAIGCAKGMLQPLDEAGQDAEQEAREERRAQAALVREIFGNPFRKINLEPEWCTPNVMRLASTIYPSSAEPSALLPEAVRIRVRKAAQAGRFELLSSLWEALRDAGCKDPDIQGHCWSKGPHVAGCWLVDLVRSVD
jgi:hypothetical protein